MLPVPDASPQRCLVHRVDQGWTHTCVVELGIQHVWHRCTCGYAWQEQK